MPDMGRPSRTCDVDGCEKRAVARLFDTRGGPKRCIPCLRADLGVLEGP